ELRVLHPKADQRSADDPAEQDHEHHRAPLVADHPDHRIRDEAPGEVADDDREIAEVAADEAGDGAGEERCTRPDHELARRERAQRIVPDEPALPAARSDRALDRTLRADRLVAAPAPEPRLAVR